MHAFGLYHHQDRYDRDNYIVNIPSIAHTNDDTYNYGSPYDYGSDMHYARKLIKLSIQDDLEERISFR